MLTCYRTIIKNLAILISVLTQDSGLLAQTGLCSDFPENMIIWGLLQNDPSSSCRTISMDLPDCLPLLFSIVHRFQYVFKATSCIGTELLYVGSCCSSCLCLSMWRGPQEYVTYEFVPTSPAVSHMSGSSNLDIFHDGW